MKHRTARKFRSTLAALALLLGAALFANPADHARIDLLRRELARHDELYYRQAAPEISDAAYDALKAELRRLEAMYPNFGDKPAETVGDDRAEGFAKHRHGAPMPGLDKAVSDAELAAFHARAAGALGHGDAVYRIEPKFDGVAVSLVYVDGRLARAVTRGDGTEGDDITANVRALCAPPETLAGTEAGGAPGLVEVRGEIFISEAEFARINRERAAAGEALFANPRNLAAGSVKALDPATNAGRRLSLVCYGWGAWEPTATRPETLTAFGERLARWGLPGVEGARLATGWTALLEQVEAMRRERAALGVPTDGVVVKLERVADQERLGTGPAAPRWAVARKFPAERAATRLAAITWQVGRTGVLTPVAELEPVRLAGSVVARASLHNAAGIAALDLRLGDTVWVAKAGEIIPEIVEVDRSRRVADARVYTPPTACPACAAELATEGAALRCPRRSCPAQAAARVEYFASKAGVNIRGLGPATVELLVEHGLVRSPADLYALDAAALAQLPGLGEKSATRLAASIGVSRAAGWPAVLRALGLPGVGAARAEVLARVAPDWAALPAVDVAALTEAGFGENAAGELVAFLANPEVRAELAALVAAGVGEGAGANGKTTASGEEP
ncbi:MAG: NAD-dependent DNA ligase LigA [Verrucomicrobiota bacterium]